MIDVEPLLLTAVPISTYANGQHLTNASGFFFQRGERLFLVTSRHVMYDQPSNHFPDMLEVELHDDRDNLASSSRFTLPLYLKGQANWRQGMDASGQVDVAVLEVFRQTLPANVAYRAFGPEHLLSVAGTVEVGTPLLVVGFPLGFHDTLHHMPVVRHAIVASSFGLRFQGQGYFLTDSRTHRGSSGAAVVMRSLPGTDAACSDLPWMLLGIHSARLDVGTRDLQLDEALGLNVAWYSDILTVLTE